MTPEAKQLLKDKPELCKEIAEAYAGWYINHLGDDSFETFRKEHTKPDWEILEFRATDGSSFYLKGNGKYHADRDAKIGLIKIEHLLYGSISVEDGALSIHSVRRSDGEVFEGNRTRSHGAIQGFRINADNEMVCLFENGRTAYIRHVTKLKPLFKTEDGVDFYKGDYATAVDTNLMVVCDTATHYYGDCDWYKYFSTREAAEAWVEDHKPRYSIADLKARGLHI